MAAGEETLAILVKLRGGAATEAELKRLARNLTGVRQATDEQAAASGRADRSAGVLRRSWGLLAGMAARSAAAIGGVSAAAVAFEGLRFDANMEQQTVAFTNFLGSAGAARGELDQLYQVAAKTPFEFQDVVGAARKFLAYGMTVQDANKWLNVMGDTISGIGGGTDEINRMVLAIGQIQAKGKMSAEELRQLAELGIPAYSILQDKLGLTAQQVANIGNAGISAADGLQALQQGLAERFGGMSSQQAQTFTGQLSTARDYARQFLGVMMQPGFDWLRTTVLPATTAALQQLTEAFKAGGPEALLAKLDDLTGAGGRLEGGVHALAGVLGGLASALGFAYDHAELLLGIASPFLGMLVAWRVATLLLAAAEWGLVAAFTAFNFIVGLSPLGWLVIAIGALIGVAVLLVSHWNDVKAGLSAVWDWMRGAAADVVDFIVGYYQGLFDFFGSLPGRIADLAHGMWDGIGHAFRAMLNWIIGAWNHLHFTIGGWTIDPPGPGKVTIPRVNVGLPPIPMLAAGGDVSRRGAAVVGDAGPELLELPAGARVTPLSGGRSPREVVRLVTVEGRVLAEAVFGAAEDAAARA